MGSPPFREVPASNPQSRRVQRYVTYLYAGFITYVSLAPGQRVPEIFNWGRLFSPDKVAHFGAYAIFAVLLSFSIGITSPLKRTAMAVVFAALFGAVMEFIQGVSGMGRSFDPVDMVANLIGALLGGLVYWIFRLILNKYSAPAGS